MPARLTPTPATPAPEGLSPSEFARLFTLPVKEAAAYMAGRGLLTESFDWRDVYGAEHAHQFTVSRLARLDLLQSVHDAVVRVTDGDLSRRGFMGEVRATLEQSGWWGEKQVRDPATGEVVTTRFTPSRLTLIYDMNTRTAHAAGRWERFERNKKTHPHLRYITKRDERVRASHAEWDGVTLPVDHPWWNTHYPPNGWRCRCRVMAMSQREYDAGRGKGWLKIEAPVIETRLWKNPRTGDEVFVPVGIDPGFDYNVGKAGARAKGLERLVADKLAGASPALAAAAERAGLRDNGGMNDAHIRSLLQSERFADFFHATNGAPGRFPVSSLTEEERRLFGVTEDVLWLSRTSLDEHRDRHPEVTIEDYRRIPDIVRNGAVWGGYADRRYLLLLVDGKPYRAAIKADAQGFEAWFLSLVVSGKQKPPKGAVRLR